MAFNKQLLTTDGGQAKGGVSFQKFTYLDSVDGQSIVETPGYFNTVKDRLNDNDIIQVLDNTRSPAVYYTLKVKTQGGLNNDTETEIVSSGGGGGGAGDVVGPILAIKDNISTFADNTGKIIKDSGVAVGNIAEAKATSIQAQQTAVSAEQTANDAAQKVQDFYTHFADLKPWKTITTYKEGDFVTYTQSPWRMILVSKTNSNTGNTPPANPNESSSYWNIFDYTHIGTDEYFAKFREARFAGDGAKKTFNISQEFPGFTPDSDDNSTGVFINNLIISKLDYTISKNTQGESLITFSSAPPAPSSQDHDAFNIIINAGQAKIVEIEHAVPLGGSMIFTTPRLQQGWLELNGQTISSTTYPELVELLNPGQTTATLLDLRPENLHGEIRAIKAFDTINNPGSIDIGGLVQDVSKNTNVIKILKPISDKITYTAPNTIEWSGTARSDDNTTDLVGSGLAIVNTNTTAHTHRFLFVGYDNDTDKNVILDFATDDAGIGLTLITGVKRFIGVDTGFPTDSDGNLAEFNNTGGTNGEFEFTLWRGLTSSTNTSLLLNDSILNYNRIESTFRENAKGIVFPTISYSTTKLKADKSLYEVARVGSVYRRATYNDTSIDISIGAGAVYIEIITGVKRNG